MANWSSETNNIVEFAVSAIFGFGIALYLGSTFLTALPANSVAANGVSQLITGLVSAITQVLVPVILIIFVLFLYLIVKHTGILGKKKKE